MNKVARAHLIRFGSTLAAGLLLASGALPAQAADRTGTAAATRTVETAGVATQRAASPDQMICTQVDVPFSRISRRVCRTRASWSRSDDIILGEIPAENP